MDKKQLINNLLLDLAQDASMNKVMSMAQAISFELYNDLFSDWLERNKEDIIIVNKKRFLCIENFLAA